MKINIALVSEAYLDFWKRKRKEVSAICPESELLARCVTREGSRKARKRIIEHVAECPDCARKIKCMLGISEEVDRLADDVMAPKRESAGLESQKKRLAWAPVSRRTAAAILAGLLGLIVVSYSVLKIMDRSGPRGRPNARLVLLSPGANASISLSDVRFAWAELPGAEHYVVEVFDRSLELLWQSGPQTGNMTSIPTAAGLDITRGKKLFWRVTAVLANGKEIRSRLAKFFLK